MKSNPAVYIDFNRFVAPVQNRDLLSSSTWQRNLGLLVASLKNRKGVKSVRRR